MKIFGGEMLISTKSRKLLQIFCEFMLNSTDNFKRKISPDDICTDLQA